ncbi:hypothetical protein ACNKHN_20515 [Shigella flexneri]
MATRLSSGAMTLNISQRLNTTDCDATFLPMPPIRFHLESDLATALAASRNILVVVPAMSLVKCCARLNRSCVLMASGVGDQRAGSGNRTSVTGRGA